MRCVGLMNLRDPLTDQGAEGFVKIMKNPSSLLLLNFILYTIIFFRKNFSQFAMEDYKKKILGKH